MKYLSLFKTLLASVLLLAVACGDNPAPEVVPPNVDPPQPPAPAEAPFEVRVLDVTAVMATVEVEPLDKTAGYYMDVLSEHNFKEAEKSGIDSYLQWMIANLTESMDMTFEEVMEMITSYGSDGFYLTTLLPDMNYYAIAVGINEQGMATTEVVSVPFRTQPAPKSENTFDVNIVESESGNHTFEITPSNEDPYVCAIYPCIVTGEIPDDEIASYVISNNMAWGAIEQITHTGPATVRDTEKSGWEYELIVFGYAEGLATTEVQRHRVTAPAGGDPAACGFDFTLTFEDFKMYPRVSPTDGSIVYICDVMEEEYYQAMLQQFNSSEEALAANLEAMIEMYVAELGGRGPVVEMLTLMGPIRYEMRFKALTEYRQWAVAVDSNGKPAAPFVLSEKVMSPDDVTSDVELKLKGYTCYNGTDLYNLDPETYKGFKGFAAVALEVEPSEGAAEWWSYIALEDLTDRPRATIINNLLLAPTEKNATTQLIACYWGTNTIMGVAKDADGNYGPLLMEVIELSKDTAAPLPDNF